MKKVVISPTDTKAIAFFNNLSTKKDELKKKVDKKLDIISAAIKKQKAIH